MTAKIQFIDVRYQVQHQKRTGTILDRVSFAVPTGKQLTILGPSGSGKTTVLRLCNRLIDPSAGSILLDGQSILEISPLQVRKQVRYVAQLPVFIKDLSLEENLLFGLCLGREPEQGNRKIGYDLLHNVGLKKEILQQQQDELSAGQAQRICLARSLAPGPEVLLLDEPTSALDFTARLELEKLIRHLQEEKGLTSIFVTHDLEQARRLGGEAALLARGTIVESGPVEQLLENPREALTRQFIEGNLKDGLEAHDGS